MTEMASYIYYASVASWPGDLFLRLSEHIPCSLGVNKYSEDQTHSGVASQTSVRKRIERGNGLDFQGCTRGLSRTRVAGFSTTKILAFTHASML